jgi:uncharacterized protein
MAAKRTFVVQRPVGSHWRKGVYVREQPLWDEHAAFVDKLFDDGRVLLAGPYEDGSGALIVVEHESEDAARRLFDDDPWTIHDILRTGEVKAWRIFLDARKRS